jgi:hypothetical protein
MKLKQKFALALCTFYVMSVIGIALSMHFCSGKLADVSLYANKTSCKYCKTEPIDKKDDGCCKNTNVDVKVKDSHQVEAAVKLPKLFSFETFLPSHVVSILKPFFPKYFGGSVNKAPPRTSTISLQILNCVFRN